MAGVGGGLDGAGCGAAALGTTKRGGSSRLGVGGSSRVGAVGARGGGGGLTLGWELGWLAGEGAVAMKTWLQTEQRTFAPPVGARLGSNRKRVLHRGHWRIMRSARGSAGQVARNVTCAT